MSLTAWLLLAQVSAAPAPLLSCDAAVGALALPADVAARVRETLTLRRGTVVRWPAHPHRVIRVWIQARQPPLGSVESNGSDGSEWGRAVGAAMRAWNDAAPGVTFATAEDSGAADVHVRWAPVLRRRHGGTGPPAAGRTTVLGDPATGAIAAARIDLAEVSSRGIPFPPGDVHAAALHEFGHVLGLTHRGDVPSVMAPRDPAPAITPDDRALLRAWYALPPGAACQDSASAPRRPRRA